tara:strand:+ start:1368 stop:1568 length:201 start_codon:yes stop_codon:yes gene_type:complete
MAEEEMRDWIDDANYHTLLQKNRFAPVGGPLFQGEVGRHFLRVIAQKRDELPSGEAGRISKEIGWE